MTSVIHQDRFYIRYKPYAHADTLSLSSIGTSLIAFDDIIQKAFRLSKIEGDIQSSIVHAEDGSIILDIGINLILGVGSNPNGFSNIQDCLDFLVLANYEKYKLVQSGAEIFSDTYNSLESFYKDHPIAYQLSLMLITFMLNYVNVGGLAKNPETTNIYNQTIINQNIIKLDNNIYVTKDQLTQIIQDHKKGVFNDMVNPIIQDDAEKIEIGAYDINNKRMVYTTIDSGNFENYLSDGIFILPQYENGKLYRFQGRIVSMQVARGETIGFKAVIDEKSRQLLSKVGESHSVEEYKDLFNQEVYIEAIIQRTSIYKKPTLLIQKIEPMNIPLPFEME